MTEQVELPKVPLPDIPKTLERYLDAIEAVLTDEEKERAKNQVQKLTEDSDMIEEVGKYLRDKNENEENWAYDYWLNDMYLNNPIALPVNSNPGWVFPDQKHETNQDRMNYIAKIAHGLLMFKEKIEASPLPQDKVTSRNGDVQYLCMEQYYRILNTIRTPGPNGERQIITDGRGSNVKEHIIVMKKGHMFAVNVKTDGVWIDQMSLASLLIALDNEELNDVPLNERVALLTSAARDRWAVHKEALKSVGSNSDFVSTIESCLFLICLDERVQNETDDERSLKNRFMEMVSGSGPFINGSNRWFDKTIQIISCPDGTSGICYEHSVAEGIAVVSVISDIISQIDNDQGYTETEADKSRISKIEFELSDELRDRTNEALEEFKNLSDDTDVEIFRFKGFGKNFMKSAKCSPDAFVQMALQLAYYSLHDCLCFTYESASTRRFKCGRVDNIRSSHPEALKWVHSMRETQTEKEGCIANFKEAIIKQTTLIKENINGQGLDIPLLGLREALKYVRPNKTCDLFEDETYSKINHFKLSTSQVPISLPDSFMGYGAVVPDGYGISYNLQNDDIIFCVASFYSCIETSSIRMVENLENSLMKMQELLK